MSLSIACTTDTILNLGLLSKQELLLALLITDASSKHVAQRRVMECLCTIFTEGKQTKVDD
jgi:hypothetical protein